MTRKRIPVEIESDAPVPHGRTLVARTARELERISLEHAAGAFIGAEETLLQRLGVSRPTLRQAAKIAENDRMIEVRRGTRGGFYAQRPNADDLVQMFARFLRVRGATLLQVMDANSLVAARAAELAASCRDADLRARLEALAARLAATTTRGQLIVRDHELAGLVAAMSGNPAIELVMAMGYSFGRDEESSTLFNEPGQIAEAVRLQVDLAEAILRGEPDLARLMMERRSRTFRRWLAPPDRDRPSVAADR